LLLLGALVVPITRRARRGPGAALLIALPFLAAFMIFGLPQAGLFTWYSSGDDWWMFQRYAYRIYMEKFWLEGGQVTFWYQPFYRWIAGALHMVFGDSSVGELYWDAACATVGALFAFRLTSTFAGFRPGVIAGVTTLAILTLGPAWYLFGRGLSELSSMGFLYGAALLAWRGRGGHWPAIVGAAVLSALAFYTRLNNLPMAAALVAFALPVSMPGRDLLRSTRWWTRASKPVVFGMVLGTAAALWLFALRTYHFTGMLDPFYGTQATHLGVLKPGDSIANDLRNVAASVMMILTMNDPPRADPRAIPIVFGMMASVLSVLGIGRFGRLPLNASLFCLAGIAGAVVARGTAYPGRFSVHLIPVTVAMTVCAVSLFIPQRKSMPHAHPQPNTT
jgi:hypothetical protein